MIKKNLNFLPITIQHGESNKIKLSQGFTKGKIEANIYQSNDVNSQQFYKPISKIIKL